MLTVLGALAEFERDLIRARRRRRRDTGNETLEDIGRNYNVSAATISRLSTSG